MRSKKYRIATLKGWIGSTPAGSARLNKLYQTMKQEIKEQRLLNIETWY
jgi:hypothetical protein